jgi:RNase H-fold protein (predicted Holliday junction resolvase)
VISRITNLQPLIGFYGEKKYSLNSYLNKRNKEKEFAKITDMLFIDDVTNIVVGDATMPKGLKGSESSLGKQFCDYVERVKGKGTVIFCTEHRSSVLDSNTKLYMHHPRLPLSKKKVAKLKLQRQQREQHREQEREQRERRERRDMAAEDERGAIMEENIGIGKRLKTQFDDGNYYTGTVRNLKRRKDGRIIKIYIVYDDGKKTEVCDWPDESVILLENNMIVNHDRCNEVQELRNVEEIARISEDSLVGAIERFRSRTDSEFFSKRVWKSQLDFAKENKKGILSSKVYGLYQVSKPGYSYLWNRDINASINIVNIYKSLLQCGVVPWEFRKEVELKNDPNYQSYPKRMKKNSSDATKEL